MHETQLSVERSTTRPRWKLRDIACLRPLTRLIARSLIPISRDSSPDRPVLRIVCATPPTYKAHASDGVAENLGLVGFTTGSVYTTL